MRSRCWYPPESEVHGEILRNPSSCINCRFASLTEVPLRAPIATATSDCRPWNLTLRLTQCPECGFVQTIVDDSWRESVREIYRLYDSYFQSSSKDQLTFLGDTGESRTYAFVKEILKEIELPMGARVLDFGCGSGNVLRALSRLRPDLFLDGFDLDSRAEARLRSIPNLINFFSKDPPTSGGYQLVVFSHTLEHLENPATTLHLMSELLTRDGQLAIAVPDCLADPIKLTVADHCSHFFPESLAAWLIELGFSPRTLPTGSLSRECLVLARRDVEQSESAPRTPTPWFPRALEWLQESATQLRLADRRAITGVFGTSIAGAWVVAQEPQLANFFVDEDSSRNRTFHDRDVYGVDSIPHGRRVLVPFTGEYLTSILGRLRSRRPDVHWCGLHEIANQQQG